MWHTFSNSAMDPLKNNSVSPVAVRKGLNHQNVPSPSSVGVFVFMKLKSLPLVSFVRGAGSGPPITWLIGAYISSIEFPERPRVTSERFIRLGALITLTAEFIKLFIPTI